MIAAITNFVGAFLSFVLLYKYIALFLIAYVAALAIPFPASTTLAAAGAFASQGYMNIYGVLLTALAANIGGDMTSYFIARQYGERVLRKIGFGRLLRSKAYARMSEYISDFPRSLIFFTRFLTEAGPAVNVLSGLTQLPLKTFIPFDVIGETSYVLLFGLTGYFLGNQWENNIGFAAKVGLAVVALGASFNLIQYLLYRKRKKAKEAKEKAQN
jgi:membrane-associated protein